MDDPTMRQGWAGAVVAAGRDAAGVGAALAALRAVLDRLTADGDHGRHFLATYTRTTVALGEAVRRGDFEDPVWVDGLDLAFARLYLDAQRAHDHDPWSAPRPWRAALGADPSTHPVLLVLLGMNAHINYDLPQALLATITGEQFRDGALLAGRRRDHERIDAVLASQVAVEHVVLREAARHRAPAAAMLLAGARGPLDRLAARRVLRESRRRVWHNAVCLDAARRRGPDEYRTVLAELELLAAARVNDLMTPGNVLIRLAAGGFGVTLPAP